MRALTLLALPFLLAACDWMLMVDAEVRVEPAVQRSITTWPQQLLLHHDALEAHSDRGGTSRIAVLCAPSDAVFVAEWQFGRVNGCGEPATLTAWLEPLDPALELPCGPVLGEGTPVAVDVPPLEAPAASARVFEGRGGCPRIASVVLEIVAPQL